MSDHYDIELLIKSHIPIIVIETHEELRAVELLTQITRRLARPVFKWSVTEGLRRLDQDYAPQRHNSQPLDVLQHIKAVSLPGLFILADFHPYWEDPLHVRLLKDIALTCEMRKHTLVLLSHHLDIPPELHKFSARAVLTLPNPSELHALPPLGVPKGILLLGVQGCGKSLAAKAVAGTWGIPLLRLDFGTLYNKFFGETERNLRESLKTAEAMAPCVLWADEIEKGVSTDGSDNATSRRVLGTLLTWLAEKKTCIYCRNRQ